MDAYQGYKRPFLNGRLVEFAFRSPIQGQEFVVPVVGVTGGQKVGRLAQYCNEKRSHMAIGNKQPITLLNRNSATSPATVIETETPASGDPKFGLRVTISTCKTRFLNVRRKI